MYKYLWLLPLFLFTYWLWTNCKMVLNVLIFFNSTFSIFNCFCSPFDHDPIYLNYFLHLIFFLFTCWWWSNHNKLVIKFWVIKQHLRIPYKCFSVCTIHQAVIHKFQGFECFPNKYPYKSNLRSFFHPLRVIATQDGTISWKKYQHFWPVYRY